MGKIISFLTASLGLFLLTSCTLPTGSTATPSPAFPAIIHPASTIIVISPTVESTSTTVSAPATVETTKPAATQATAPVWMPAAGVARRYAVFLVGEDDVLNIRSAAGTGHDVTGHFAPDAADVHSTGQSATSGGDVWLEVENPFGGTGWVNSRYLTEFVTSQEFCSDSRVDTLLDDFKQAINAEDGDLLETLVSPAHGLELAYWRYGPSANYTPKEAAWVFDSAYEVNWGSGPSGLDDVGTFREFPLPSLEEVLNDEDYEQQCNDISSASMYMEPWPAVYSNVNFYALYKPGTPDVDLDWGTWLAGVEYVDGEPYLFALIRFVWEP